MDENGLHDLVMVTRAHLLEQQRRAKPGLDAIKRLRAQRAALDDLDRDSTASIDLQQMRAIGADVLWRAWLDRQRRDVNMQLARALAEQDHLMRALRKAQGRHDVLTALLKQAETDVQRKKVVEDQARLQDSGLLKRRKRS